MFGSGEMIFQKASDPHLILSEFVRKPKCKCTA